MMKKIGLDARLLLKKEPSSHAHLFQCLLKQNYLFNYDFYLFLYTNQKEIYQNDYLNAPNVFIRYINSNSSCEFWYFNKYLVKAMQQDSIDLLVLPGYKLPILSVIPSITIIHDLYAVSNFQKKLNPIKHPKKKILKEIFIYLRFVLYFWKAKKIIAVSNYSKSEAIRLFKIPNQKLEVCYNSCLPIKFSDNLFNHLTVKNNLFLLNLKTNSFFVYLGANYGKKNLKNMILAYSYLEQNIKDSYPLVLRTKKGPELNLVYQLGLENRVIYIENYISEEEKSVLLTKALALVYISYGEGFGIPVAEAMSVGTPPIISREDPALLEIAGDMGIQVPYKQPTEIAKVLTRVVSFSKQEYERLSEGCLERAKQFSPETVSNQLATLINDCL